MLELVSFAIKSFNARKRNPNVKKPAWNNMYMPVEVKRSLWSDLYVLDINTLSEYSREALAWLMLNCTDPMVPLRVFEARFGYGADGRKMLMKIMQYPRSSSGDHIYPNPTTAYATTSIIEFTGNDQYYKYCHMNCAYWTLDKNGRDMLKDLFNNIEINPEMKGTLVKVDCYKMGFEIKKHGPTSLFTYPKHCSTLKNLYVIN